MSISVNTESCVPPGFRFHPTEEELLNYYLRKKVTSEKIDLDVIRDVDLNKLEPWDIQEKCRIGSTPQNDWYFFSHKDKKYPTGTRTNRATAAGFWKATGRDKVIYSSVTRIGMRKTLVFYRGRAPHGQKSDWIMHEYRLDDHSHLISHSNASSSMGEGTNQEDAWVVCRVFKKKNHHKAIDSPNNSSSVTSDAKTQLLHHPGGGDDDDDALDQILQYMGRTCKRESQWTTTNIPSRNMEYLRPIEIASSSGLQEMFMKLPAPGSPTITPLPNSFPLDHSCDDQTSYGMSAAVDMGSAHRAETGSGDWAAFDRLLASQLNGPSEGPKPLDDDDDSGVGFHSSARVVHAADDDDYDDDYDDDDQHGGDGDLWSLTRTSLSLSDRISHASL
ncbi:hypothetical protein GW17_00031598 [Ensete ventricosum]|nr:hypothetical protein GW17_00031598 [Ensete ventricosum]